MAIEEFLPQGWKLRRAWADEDAGEVKFEFDVSVDDRGGRPVTGDEIDAVCYGKPWQRNGRD